MIQFDVPGIPQGKGRPRAGKTKDGRVQIYTPGKTVMYESTVALFASQAMAGRPLLKGPLRAVFYANMPIPASFSKRKREAAVAQLIYPQSKPDWDNVAKTCCDAMNGVVFVDDSQIVEGIVRKRYSVNPSVSVMVEQIVAEEW